MDYVFHQILLDFCTTSLYSEKTFSFLSFCSLEKLKPEKELEKAKSHILRYKLRIRALFQHIDQSLAVGKLPESLFDSQGEIDSEDVGRNSVCIVAIFFHRYITCMRPCTGQIA